jgi:hypothetical protein
MVRMARSAQVLLVKEVALIAAVLRNVDLRRHFVVDVGTRRSTTAHHSNRAQWIPREDVGLSSPAPLCRVIQTAQAASATMALAIASSILGSRGLGDWCTERHVISDEGGIQ